MRLEELDHFIVKEGASGVGVRQVVQSGLMRMVCALRANIYERHIFCL